MNEYSKSSIKLIQNDLSMNNKTNLLTTFQNEKLKNKSSSRHSFSNILIKTLCLFKIEHICIKIKKIILMNLDWVKNTKKQTIKRILRLKQTKATFLYRLLCSEILVEEQIVKIQNLKMNFQDLTFAYVVFIE